MDNALLTQAEIALARHCLEYALSHGARKARITLSKSLMNLIGLLCGEVDKTAHALDRSLQIQLFVEGRYGAFSSNKLDKEGLTDKVALMNADCCSLPFPTGSFDAIVSAFGLRNFENLDACLKEMHRVLDDNGRVAIADLCSPTAFPMRQLFWLYQKMVMPLAGRLISRDDKAYTYLPETMCAIPQGDDMKAIFEKAGFHDVGYRRLPFGMCMLYTAGK